MKKLRVFVFSMILILIFQLSSQAAAQKGGDSTQGGSQAVERLSPEFQISLPSNPDADRRYPVVAYNPDEHEYLVAWDNLWPGGFTDVYARRVSSSGRLLSWFCVATGAGVDNKTRMVPSLAYNAIDKEYLVVYMYDALGDGIHWEVWGRRVAWNGSWLGPELQIFTWANRSFNFPVVVWNSTRNEYFVIANAMDTTTSIYNDVAGRRVMADGTTPFPGHSISTQSQITQPQAADVTYNPAMDEYLVVWSEYFPGYDWDIKGARVYGMNDQVVPPGEFFIDTYFVDQGYPSVTNNLSDRYLVVWSQNMSTEASDWDIYGAELDTNGSRLDDSIPIAVSSDNEYDPVAAINPITHEYFVTWRRFSETNGFQVWGFGWNPNGERVLWLPFQIADQAGLGSVDIAPGVSNYMIVYEKISGTIPHIFGTTHFNWSMYMPFVRK